MVAMVKETDGGRRSEMIGARTMAIRDVGLASQRLEIERSRLEWLMVKENKREWQSEVMIGS